MEYNSDIDQCKRNLPLKFTLDSSEMCFDEEPPSARNHRGPKYYRSMRSSSVPRIYVADTSAWRNYDLPNYCTTDFRRSPAIYIEQDIINKQRQEIQLLMDELSNRDQELNDLVLSHQKQVKVWECDNEKQMSLHTRLSLCEDEIRFKEEHLKKVVENMAHIKEQSEVDALELSRTHDEMIKLTEKIMENSVYIQEMENQNKKLQMSLREFMHSKQTFSAREQELLSCLKEKDLHLAEKQQESTKLSDHIKFLDSQCQELGERNNNMTEESVNWKHRFNEMKEEADRFSDDCMKKDESMHKMTHQLHEALQQAIALQKALFISCEREKCKEEVMYSLRKQHKRTMQELQNTRELYDRLNRDTTYQLSTKEKDSVGEEEGKRRIDARQEHEADKWRHESRRKTIHKSKQSSELCDDNPKEKAKERMSTVREDKNAAESRENTTKNNLDKEAGRSGSKKQNFGAQTDMSKVINAGLKNSAKERCFHQCSANPQADMEPCKSGHVMYVSTQTPALFVEQSGFARLSSGGKNFVDISTQVQPKGFGNSSRNADVVDSTSTANSQRVDASCKTDHTGASSLVSLHDHLEDSDSSLKDADGVEAANPLQEASGACCDPQIPKNTPNIVNLSRNNDSSTMDKDQKQTQSMIDAEVTSTQKQCSQNATVPFDSRERPKGSFSVPDFEVYSPTSVERNCCSAMNSYGNQCTHVQPRQVLDIPRGYSSDSRVEQRRAVDQSEAASSDESRSSDKRCIQEREKFQQFSNESSQEQRNCSQECQQFSYGKDRMVSNCSNEQPPYLWHEPCGQCRARGRQCCNCPPTQTSNNTSCLKATPGAFDLGVSKSDGNYVRQIKSTTNTPKVSFMGINTCSEPTSEGHNKPRNFQESGKDNQMSRMDDTMRASNCSPFHPDSKKLANSFPMYGSYQSQTSVSSHPKVVCEHLPNDVSVYLARQHPIRREEYYNNNNQFDCHQMNFEPRSSRVGLNEPDVGSESSDENTQSQDLTFCGQPGFCAHTVQAFLQSDESSGLVWGAERMREVQQKCELLISSERQERGLCEGGGMFGDRDNNNNRTEVVCAGLYCSGRGEAGLIEKGGKGSPRGDVKGSTRLSVGGEGNRGVNGEGSTRLSVGGEGNRGVNVENGGNRGVNVKGSTRLSVGGEGNRGVNVENGGNRGVNVENGGNRGVNVKGSTRVSVGGEGNRGVNGENGGNGGVNVKNEGDGGVNVKGNTRLSVGGEGNRGVNGENGGNGGVNVKNEGDGGVNGENEGNGGVNLKGNTRISVGDEGNRGVNVKNEGNRGVNVKNGGNRGVNVKNEGNTRIYVRGEGNKEGNVKDEDNSTIDVKCADNIAMNDTAKVGLKGTSDTISSVEAEGKVGINPKIKDNVVSVKGAVSAVTGVKDKDTARLCVKDKDTARLCVKDKDTARLCVKDKDTARLCVKDKDTARLCVKDKDTARLCVKDKDTARLCVKDKDTARLCVKDKDTARLCVKDKDTARLCVKDKDTARLCVKDKDTARLCVKDKDTARLCVKDKDTARLCVKDKDTARLCVKDKDTARLCVKDANNTVSNVRPMDKAIINGKGTDKTKLSVVDKNSARLDVVNVKNSARLDVVNVKNSARLDVVNVKNSARLDVKVTNSAKLDVMVTNNARLDRKVTNSARLDVKVPNNARLEDASVSEGSELKLRNHLSSAQRSTFLQKSVILSSADRLEFRRKYLLSAQNSFKTSVEDSTYTSYFCPEESDAESDTQVHLFPRK